MKYKKISEGLAKAREVFDKGAQEARKRPGSMSGRKSGRYPNKPKR